jgi:hypothetical protein
MKTYTDDQMHEAWEAGFRYGKAEGKFEQYHEDRERFEAETAALRTQLGALLKHLANLEALKPLTFVLKEKP